MALNTKAVFAGIEAMLLKHGFRKRQGNIYTKSEFDDIDSWIGLNRATRDKNLEINMVVGLRFRQVESIVHELMGISDDHLTPPTIAGNIGYIGGQEKYYAVVLSTEAEISRKVTDLEKALLQWGIPFLEKTRNLSELVNILKGARYLMPEQVLYRLPVALYMLGKSQEALNYIIAKEAEQAMRTDPAANLYGHFTKAFRELCAGQNSVE